MSWRVHHFFEADEISSLHSAMELYANGEIVIGKVQLQAHIKFPEMVGSGIMKAWRREEFEEKFGERNYGYSATLTFSFADYVAAEDVMAFLKSEFERVIKRQHAFKQIVAQNGDREYDLEVVIDETVLTPIKLLHLKEVF